jgi:hypothetical protein
MTVSFEKWSANLIRQCNDKQHNDADWTKGDDIAGEIRKIEYAVYVMESYSRRWRQRLFRVGAIGIHREPASPTGNNPEKRLSQCNQPNPPPNPNDPFKLQKEGKPWHYLFGATLIMPDAEPAPRFVAAIAEGMLQRIFAHKFIYHSTSCFESESRIAVVRACNKFAKSTF